VEYKLINGTNIAAAAGTKQITGVESQNYLVLSLSVTLVHSRTYCQSQEVQYGKLWIAVVVEETWFAL
jgi:hypothetical protein